MRRTLLGIATALTLPGAAMSGQSDSAVKAGSLTIQGTVVDAASTTPLGGAVLVLAARDAAMAIPSRNGTPQLVSARMATSRADGAYAFNDVTVGRYQLRVRRVGYEPETLEIDLTDGSAVSKVSIGLVVLPVQLRTLHVKADASDQFGRMTDPSAADSGWRAAVVTARQRQFLSSDVRELTNADANDAGSIGEADILRAFRHVPGVTGRDDSSDELWIRGAQWDQVRVYFDGLPVLDPRHAGGTMSAVGADAIGAAFLHPGVRSVSSGAQGASLIDLRSRAARADSALSGAVGLSYDGGTASFDQRTADGRLGLTVSGRRSLGDLIVHSGEHYSEITGRTDLRTGDDAAVELSGLWTQDFPTAWNPEVRNGTTLGQGTFRFRRGSWHLSQSAGVSRYAANTPSFFFQADSNPFSGVGTLVRQSSSVTSWIVSGSALRPASTTDSWLSAGYDLLFEQASFAIPAFTLSAADTSTRLASRSTSLPTVSAWAERRWQPRTSLMLEAGLRTNVALASDVERVRLAPSLQASYQLGASTRITGGVARAFEDVQYVGGSTGIDVWALGGRGLPLLVADQASLGLERWHSESLLFGLNGYARSLTGVLVARQPTDSAEAMVLLTDRLTDRLTAATVRAYGAEASLRKLTGRVTGSVNYSLGRATQRLDALTVRAPGERLGTLDASGMVHLGRTRLGASYVTMSGAPYRRARLVPATPGRFIVLADTAAYAPLYAPRFVSVGMFVDWTGHIRKTTITPYLSALNVTARANPTVYYGSCTPSTFFGGVCSNGDGIVDRTPGLTHANLGFRLVF
jgi:Carboxypeptidase regulatory-like domain/TonB-dependent Receptor Plug Domain